MIRSVPVVLWAAVALAGCRQKAALVYPYLNFSDAAQDRGLVIVLPGVEGRGPFNEAICEGLADGGVTWAIDLADWTTSVPMNYLVNLRDEPRNRLRAQDIADTIMRYRMACPNTPVVLVGQSSGGGMAVWVAEALPPTERIDGIILLAPSLSPGYSLDSALMRTRRGIVNFYSSRDWVILGVGTTLSGTMDGLHTSSAGRVGFEPPLVGRSADLYERKLFQVPWQPAMAEAGNPGLHLTSGARVFVACYVAPLVLAQKWDVDTVLEITSGEPPPAMPPAIGRASRPASRPVRAAVITSRPASRPAPPRATSSPATQPSAVRPPAGTGR